MCPRFPTLLPLPLITLRLTSDNLLDSVLTDARGAPAFVLQTEGNVTTLSRCDSGQISASIEWPLDPPSSPKAKEPVATVSIDGRTPQPSDLLLRKSIMGNSRKFQLPGSSGSLRWKRVADHYECTLCTLACTCHSAIATLHPRASSSPGELSVYAAALTADTRQSQQHSAISVRLLEYLILTSVLLTTAHDDWRRFPNAPDFSSPPLSTRSLRQRLSSPPSSPTVSVSTSFASPTRRKLDLLEGDSEPFYSSSPTSTYSATRSLTRSRSSNYLRPPLHSTPFSTPPNTPPIAYHELPTIALPARPLPAATVAAAVAEARAAALVVGTPAPQYTVHAHTHAHAHAHPMGRSQSLQAQSRAQDAPPVPPIPHHFRAPPAPPPPAPEEAPPSYAEIEWTVKVPQRRVSSRPAREQGYLLA